MSDDEEVGDEADEDEGEEADEDELIAEIEGVLEELVAEGHLEVASKRSISSLATRQFLSALNGESLSDWLVDRPEVTELYLDEKELRERFRRVVARMFNDATPSTHHPELAAAIIANPDDAQAWSVYADWLQEQGDPRGELMSLQIDGRKKKRLEARESALLARYRRHFYGELPFDSNEDDRPRVSFRHGFFEDATVPDAFDLETLLPLESARFLRRLMAPCDDVEHVAQLLSAHTLPTTLIKLEIGKPLKHSSAWGRSTDLGRRLGSLDVAQATRGLSRLERLAITCKEVHVTELELPALRELVLQAHRLRLDKAAFLSLRSLERLDVLADGIAGPDALAALFEAPPPKLTALAIRDVKERVIVHELLPRLLKSPLARALRTLELPDDLLDDDDAQALLDAKAQLPRLETLNVGGNGFSRQMTARLTREWPRTSLRGNWREDEGDAAGEDEDEDEDENEDEDEDEERYDDVEE